MANPLEIAAIFVVSCLASLMAWELDREVLSGLFAAATGAAFMLAPESPVAKTTTKLRAQDRVILFCAGTGIHHAAVRIPGQGMQSMAIRGFIEHRGPTQAYVLTASGRATLMEILNEAERP
jgi:hypothetical protein